MKTAKRLLSLLAVVLLCASFAVPAFAQGAEAEREWQNILAKHPRLRANPSMVNDPKFLKVEPGVASWLDHHPRVRAEAAQQGAWDRGGTWRNPEWWHKNDPNWMRANHPEWARSHPEWAEHREAEHGHGHRHDHDRHHDHDHH